MPDEPSPESTLTPEDILHVDDFVSDGFGQPEGGNEVYARWMLMHFRLAPMIRLDFDRFIDGKRLFCTYEGKRYRCTGASRLGDVWLAENFDRENGYDLRVDVRKCLFWSDKP